MKVFGLGDLHLSFSQPVNPPHWEDVKEHKPMGCFGSLWERHYQRIFANWQATVSDEDVVLVPGDISWAMKLGEAVHDLEFLGKLAGKIIMVQGNHDYWWQGISKVRKALPPNAWALQNDHVKIGKTAVCGTRGWLCPNDNDFSEHDEKIYRRELLRLRMSLESVPSGVERVVVMMHYMPTNDRHEESGFIELMREFGIAVCVYGHLHGEGLLKRLPEKKWGIRFFLVSADFLEFKPRFLWEE
ncbi:metallophosphoesterase [Calderihabitans maritimus]|uniref:Metallophosphoesterase n=1 Tax=Calderihabitans maritimus TaxID=1246530 RepID=A0A1Z5HVJ0_9FIRM|nr:metallophosphoesterase [Calderihabitans maritimus]GAW93357.1 metallophosphoesterase [Calderihabitans maritimus]